MFYYHSRWGRSIERNSIRRENRGWNRRLKASALPDKQPRNRQVEGCMTLVKSANLFDNLTESREYAGQSNIFPSRTQLEANYNNTWAVRHLSLSLSLSLSFSSFFMFYLSVFSLDFRSLFLASKTRRLPICMLYITYVPIWFQLESSQASSWTTLSGSRKSGAADWIWPQPSV